MGVPVGAARAGHVSIPILNVQIALCDGPIPNFSAGTKSRSSRRNKSTRWQRLYFVEASAFAQHSTIAACDLRVSVSGRGDGGQVWCVGSTKCQHSHVANEAVEDSRAEDSKCDSIVPYGDGCAHA